MENTNTKVLLSGIGLAAPGDGLEGVFGRQTNHLALKVGKFALDGQTVCREATIRLMMAVVEGY